MTPQCKAYLWTKWTCAKFLLNPYIQATLYRVSSVNRYLDCWVEGVCVCLKTCESTPLCSPLTVPFRAYQQKDTGKWELSRENRGCFDLVSCLCTSWLDFRKSEGGGVLI